MVKKILVANRGEIALRVIRACKELGVRSVAVYSEADRESPHVQWADEAVCIGPPEAAQSYLNIPGIISAAEIAKVEAIHPGYGFLAENAHFAEVCEASGITFIGPTPESIRRMGDKAEARKAAVAVGVPVVPGSDGAVNDEQQARQVAAQIGYPLLIKAVGGGGGRGMRVVQTEGEVARAFLTARGEASAAFGNPAVYIERYFTAPRHVELQMLGDGKGGVISLGERDCSIQRRHQKLIEESPCPVLSPALREAMGRAAVKIAETVAYRGAGTVEFLLDGEGAFYFIEMNTRIQVEHPVTEMVTGVDLIKAQLQIAAGSPLPLAQTEVTLTGHAIECRVNAEDPETFLPSPGKITDLRLPGGPGIRLDTHAFPGYVIPPFYDSLLAKLIAHGRDRNEAVARLRRALGEFVIGEIKTTIPLHRRIVNDQDFIAGRVSTRFLERLGYVTTS
ncbi:MAG: acetyl-CoA carboxylase biotin carboxylase subunit [Candidatus Methylomirabilales bacterium]